MTVRFRPPFLLSLRKRENQMNCPKCGSENIDVQVVNQQSIGKAHHGIIYWIFIGWWWRPIIFCIKWLIFTIPALICSLFHIGGKKQIKNVVKSVAVCKDCGNNWEI